MQADRTVIVFGVFLFVVGLSVAVNSYGYIEVERGWAMVIAGTIGFTAGLLLTALGLILRQLRILSLSAAQAALFLAKASAIAGAAEAAPPPEPAGREPEPEAETLPAPAPVEAAPAEEFATPAAERAFAPPPAWMTRASSYAASYGAARAAEPVEPVDVPSEHGADGDQDWLEKAVADEVAAQENLFGDAFAHEFQGEPPRADNAFAREAETREAESREPESQEPESAEFETREAETPESATYEASAYGATVDEMVAGEPGEVAASEPELPKAAVNWEEVIAELIEAEAPKEAGTPAREPATAEPAALHQPAPEAPADAAGEETEEPAASAETPAVLGQYEANGARYTMYADGSIDAETAHGVYRFASMDELKRFIEQSA